VLLRWNNYVRVAGVVHTKSRDTATLLGLVKRQSAFTPVEDLKSRSDFESVFQRLFLYFYVKSGKIDQLN